MDKLARTLYHSYPSELFLDKDDAKDMNSLRKAVDSGESGDLLFDAIVVEVGVGADKTYALQQLYKMQDDLNAVITAVENMQE